MIRHGLILCLVTACHALKDMPYREQHFEYTFELPNDRTGKPKLTWSYGDANGEKRMEKDFNSLELQQLARPHSIRRSPSSYDSRMRGPRYGPDYDLLRWNLPEVYRPLELSESRDSNHGQYNEDHSRDHAEHDLHDRHTPTTHEGDTYEKKARDHPVHHGYWPNTFMNFNNGGDFFHNFDDFKRHFFDSFSTHFRHHFPPSYYRH